MRVYTLQDETGHVQDAFVGNGDELSDKDFRALQRRVHSLGYSLYSHQPTSVSQLTDYVTYLEEGAEQT